MTNFKQRWNILSNWQVFVIILVFAVTGSTSALIAKPILSWFGVTKLVPNIFLYWICYILLIFPIYQILLVLFGFLFGQFRFFWRFEIKMLHSLKLDFLANFLDKKKEFR